MAGGLCFCEVEPLADALGKLRVEDDLLILPAGVADEGVAKFLRSGGRVVAIRPGAELRELAGLTCRESIEGFGWLRFVRRVCPGARGESLWMQGGFDFYDPGVCEDAAAYLFHDANPEEEAPGIVSARVGEGTLLVYAYDPARCVARLRQGDPALANFLPKGQLTPRAAFLQPHDPPASTFWRPTADLHAAGFCGIIRQLLEQSEQPVPMLWRFPQGVPSILIYTGDEDGAPQEENDAEMSVVESFGGSMNLYVIPDHTSITREHIEAYTARGHTVSVHPNLVPAASQSPEEQVAVAEAQVRLFQEKFGWPTRTLRNHSYMWPGYLDLPELWEKLGIGMDANVTSIMRGASRHFGPFARLNAALPMRYVREDGSLIDVFQQPTQLNDDLQTNPSSAKSHKYALDEYDALIERVFEEAVRLDHSPLCVNFHPGIFRKFAEPYARAVMKRAAGLELPIWSLERWHDFWRARSAWKLTSRSWRDPILEIVLQGPPCPGLTVLVPEKTGERSLAQITCQGATVAHQTAIRNRHRVGMIPLPDAAEEAAFHIEYQ